MIRPWQTLFAATFGVAALVGCGSDQEGGDTQEPLESQSPGATAEDEGDGGAGNELAGDSGGSAANGYDTSLSSDIDGATLLRELTDAEAGALCRFLDRSYKSSIPDEGSYCIYNVSDEEVPAELCTELQTLCLGSGAFEVELASELPCDAIAAADFGFPAECEATIAEYEACARATDAAYWDAAKAASCAEPTTRADIEEPEACAPYLAKCPL